MENVENKQKSNRFWNIFINFRTQTCVNIEFYALMRALLSLVRNIPQHTKLELVAFPSTEGCFKWLAPCFLIWCTKAKTFHPRNKKTFFSSKTRNRNEVTKEENNWRKCNNDDRVSFRFVSRKLNFNLILLFLETINFFCFSFHFILHSNAIQETWLF